MSGGHVEDQACLVVSLNVFAQCSAGGESLPGTLDSCADNGGGVMRVGQDELAERSCGVRLVYLFTTLKHTRACTPLAPLCEGRDKTRCSYFCVSRRLRRLGGSQEQCRPSNRPPRQARVQRR